MTKTTSTARTGIGSAGNPERPDRRQNILDASQRLFARFGYHAVTIRQIAQEARVPLALVGYYFGQKQELYDAIFGHLSTYVNARQLGLLAALAEPLGDPLSRIIEAVVISISTKRSTSAGESCALFVSRGLTQQSLEEDHSIREYIDPVSAEFIDAIRAALIAEGIPISQPQAAWCSQFALGAQLHYLSDQRIVRLSNGVNVAADPAVIAQLVAFIVNGIRGAARSFAAATTHAS